MLINDQIQTHKNNINDRDRRAPPHSGDGSEDDTPPPSDFLLWFTSRVPPYGYGKSHGLRGLVRLLAFPPLAEWEGEADVRDFVRCVCVCVWVGGLGCRRVSESPSPLSA